MDPCSAWMYVVHTEYILAVLAYGQTHVGSLRTARLSGIVGDLGRIALRFFRACRKNAPEVVKLLLQAKAGILRRKDP